MITGKTISQLDSLSNITDNTSIPVELSGNTYHVQYSAITNNLIEQGFNNGIKLLSKQQINLNQPFEPIDVISILWCPSFNICQSPSFEIGETIINEFGVTGEVSSNYDSLDGKVINVINVSGGSFNVDEFITGLTSNFIGRIYTLTDSASLQPITLTGGTNFIIQNSFITNPSSPTFNATGGIVDSMDSGFYIQYYQMKDVLTTPNSYILNSDYFQPDTIQKIQSNQVYLKLTDIEGSDVTADLYIYGYILN